MRGKEVPKTLPDMHSFCPYGWDTNVMILVATWDIQATVVNKDSAASKKYFAVLHDDNCYSFLQPEARKADLEHELLKVNNDRNKIISSERNILSITTSNNNNFQINKDDTDEIAGHN